MSSTLNGVHPNPDIWVLLAPGKTGLQMLTNRAKKWALSSNDLEDPSAVNHMLWVPTAVGSGILEDLEHTSLNILIDTWEDKND